MQKHRAGEDNSIPFRNERYVCIHGVWFFETREGKQQGPYINKQEMQAELLCFIREQKMLNQSFQELA